jgi:hypothetical protein
MARLDEYQGKTILAAYGSALLGPNAVRLACSIARFESEDASEFEGIVVEMIPQSRRAKWTSANVRKLRGKLLLIEGGLFYDNLHFVNGDAANPVPRQPKRFSLWEIHPVV